MTECVLAHNFTSMVSVCFEKRGSREEAEGKERGRRGKERGRREEGEGKERGRRREGEGKERGKSGERERKERWTRIETPIHQTLCAGQVMLV